MVNAFAELTSYQGDFSDIKEKYTFMDLFAPLFEQYAAQPKLATKIIKYILYAFSIESTKITLGGDRAKETTLLFKELGIDEGRSKDESLLEDIVLLQDDNVLICVNKWLKWQDSRQIEFLFTLHQEYVQQQHASLSKIRTSSGEIDWDQKMKCIEHLKELKVMIKDAESELMQNNPAMKHIFKAAERGNVKNTMGAESFVK